MSRLAGTATSTLLSGYLAVQLLLPLRGLVFDERATRGNFSWNMYSRRYACSAVYSWIDEAGRVHPLHPEDYVRNAAWADRLYHRDVLPEFHAWLCRELDVTARGGRLEALVTCRVGSGPWTDLVRPGADVCTEPGGGVR
jgi:hypothetical protein